MRGNDEGWAAFISSIKAMFKDFPLTSFQVAIVNCSIVSFEQKWIESARRKTKGTAVLSNQLKSNNLCHFWEPRDCFFCLWCIVNHNKSCCPCEMFAQKAEKTSNASVRSSHLSNNVPRLDFHFPLLYFGIGILILELEYFANFLQLKCVILELSLLYWCAAYRYTGELGLTWRVCSVQHAVYPKKKQFCNVIHQNYTTIQKFWVGKTFSSHMPTKAYFDQKYSKSSLK